MDNKRNKYVIIVLLIAAVFTSCKNKWDDHDLVGDPAFSTNLVDKINQDPSLSLFSQYLVKTRYDKVLASSKTFTVWAPNNAAIQAAQAIDPTLNTDSNRLKLFIGNHIAYQSYITSLPQPSLRVKMFNGKSATFTKTTFEEANIIKADQNTGNGILQVIDKAILPKLSIWDYIKSLTTIGQAEKAYLLGQNYLHQDTSRATVLSVDPLTGLPVYDPKSGIDTLNHFIDQTQNVRSEDKQFTFIVLTDNAFAGESARISRFYKTNDFNLSATLTSFNVAKDLVLPGVYLPANLPDTLVSPFNVKIAINKNLIVSTYNASNGIVYVIDINAANNISGASFRLQDKFQPIIVQGENYSGLFSTSYSQNTLIHTKLDPNGVSFTDFTLAGLPVVGVIPAGAWARYNVTLNSIPYKIYWRTINYNTIVFRQQLTFGSPFANTFPYVTIATNNYAESFVGDYTATQYGINPAYIVADNTKGTTVGTNSITLDYLRLVPVLQ